jgi:hypothetical protein
MPGEVGALSDAGHCAHPYAFAVAVLDPGWIHTYVAK